MQISSLILCNLNSNIQYHPDNKAGSETKELCNRQMMVINAAYKTLKNSALRNRYDNQRQVKIRTIESKVGKAVDSATSKSAGNVRVVNAQYNHPKESSRRSRSAVGTASEEADLETETESLFDVFRDVFQDITMNNGSNIIHDINEFMESMVSTFIRSGSDHVGYVLSLNL